MTDHIGDEAWTESPDADSLSPVSSLEEMRSLARSFTRQAIRAMVRVMNDINASPAACQAAAATVLQLGWGRPGAAPKVEATDDFGDIIREVDAFFAKDQNDEAGHAGSQPKPDVDS